METVIATQGRAQPTITGRAGSATPVAPALSAVWALLALGLSLGHLAGLDVTPWAGADPSVLSALSTSTVAVLVAALSGSSLAALAVGHRRDGRPA
ncbi:MAG TPA: hypothetical protein VFY88_04355, partial [Intrasporangium sp.]|nr:hypothetical protein [Intrasporangium sp.]